VAQARWRIEEDHQLAKQVTGPDARQVIRWKSWHRWSTIRLLAYIYLAVAAARRASPASEADLIPITVPELPRLVRGQVVPQPRRDPAHHQRWSNWRHQHQARQAHQRWNAYADTTT
jgi:hypothetical protein